jgi:2-polyprenyl-6-methoxyphenol hydroxylase-like FAD-dependent oxidoreductase
MPVPRLHGTTQAVILGGGIAGLAAARLVARHFSRVIVLERDTRIDVASPADAFTAWERSGVPQFRHSHAFLARLRLVLLAHMPDVLEQLRAAGVREIRLADTVPPDMSFVARPDDEDVVLLACRRAVFEWALRESVRTRSNVELREGITVAGLSGTSRDGGRPVVNGVRLADDTVIPAALVVDATGRRSRAPEWLAAIGAPHAKERSADTGIFYFTRFYRLRRGKPPRGVTGLVAGDLGWVKLAIFPGDGNTFSITVGTPTGDQALKALSDPAVFERFLSAFPSIAPWRAAGMSVPIAGRDTPVLVMGQLKNRLRRFVDDEGPLAPGFVAIGDSAYHSNPIYGRGCPMALVQAALLDEALGRHPGDVRAASVYLHRESEAELRPYWDAAVAADRRSNRNGKAAPTSAMAALVRMAESAVGWWLERGLLPATRVDPVVFRGLLRVFHMLEPPEALLRSPELVLRSLPVLARVLRGDAPEATFEPVARAAVLERLTRSA